MMRTKGSLFMRGVQARGDDYTKPFLGLCQPRNI